MKLVVPSAHLLGQILSVPLCFSIPCFLHMYDIDCSKELGSVCLESEQVMAVIDVDI